MSKFEEQAHSSKRSQDRQQAADNLRLYSYMEDNFARIFSLLAPIMSFSIQNENHIRQIMFSLQHPDAQLGNIPFDNREFVQNLLMKTYDKFAGSSNGQKSEGSIADKSDNTLIDEAEESDPMAGTDDIKEQLSPSTSIKAPESPESGDTNKPRRKRKLNDENPVAIHCTDCNQVFRKGDGNYTRHLKEMKCSPHGCLECGKRFKKKSYLQSHMMNHSRVTESPIAKKTRKYDNYREKTVPLDLRIKKEIPDSNMEFFNSLNLFENNRSD